MLLKMFLVSGWFLLVVVFNEVLWVSFMGV